MASSSNSNGVPVSCSSATVLSGTQAAQLLQKLKALNAPNGSQTIKIQAIQTDPITGAKQIVTVPVSSANLRATSSSPVKIIRIPTSSFVDDGSHNSRAITTSSASGVKVVRVGPSQLSIAGSPKNIYQPNTSKVAITPTKPLVLNNTSITGGATGTSSDLAFDVTPGRGVKRAAIDFEAFSDAKRRKTSDKGGKGLRHFSMKVCEKVQAKGLTSYNEVADELVRDLTDSRCGSPTDQQYDQKNIRRRVYDALNVLMAMNIISKEKKEIKWLGLPTNSVQEANSLETEKTKRIDRIKAKTHQLQDLILQQIAFKNLVERNREREKRDGGPSTNSAIQLPFIIVNTSKKTVIECSISNDKMEYLFNFDDTFEIHDDMEVLKRMGLSLGLEHGHVSPEDLAKARAMVPRALEQYVMDLSKNGITSNLGIPRVAAPKYPQLMSEDSE